MKVNLLKATLATVGLLAASLFSQSVWAADPDFSNYTVVKTMDFTTNTYSADTKITLTTTQEGTAYETGNKLQQKIYDIATPEDLTGYLALQAVYGSKGWWIRSTKGGLYSYNAPRSGAVLNCKKGYVVAFNCTQDAANVMTLTNADGESDGPFTYEKSEDSKAYYATLTADGQVGFCGGKSAGYISSIVIYAPGIIVLQPTGVYTAVDGVKRTVKFTGANLAYNTDGSDNYTFFKDNEGNNVNTAEVTVSETTTYYVVSTNGEDKSEPLEFKIEAGEELSLGTPTYSIATMGEGFTKTYSVTCDNSDVLLRPTAKLSYSFTPSANGTAASDVAFDGTIEATEAGVYTVTASADGYTSTTVTIDNTKEYELTNTIDFTKLTAEDLSSNWKLKATGGSLPGSSSSQWPAYYDVTADEYYYDFSSETADSADIIKGLIVEFNKDGKTPKLYTGFGFMYPIYQQTAEGEDNTENKVAITNGKISVADGTSDQVAVYSYINNYGKNGTKTSVLAGDEDFALYRFSDMLTKVEVYSPKTAAPEVVIEKFSDLYALEDGTDVTIKTTDAVISVWQYAGTGNFVCVQDGTGAVRLSEDMASMMSGIGLSAGSKIVGTIYAKYTAADGTPTLDIADNTQFSSIDTEAAGEVVDVAPVEMTIAEAKQKSSISKYVEIKKAKMWADEDDWSLFYISQGKDTIKVYDKFWALPETFTAPDTIEYVKGVVVLEDGKYTIYPYGEDAVPVVVFEAENIAALANAEDNATVKLMLKDAQITVVREGRWGNTAYLEDESGAVEFGDVYDFISSESELDLKEGTVFNGYIMVMYAGNWGGMQIMSTDETVTGSIFSVEDDTPTPMETTIAEVKKESNCSRFVSFKNTKIVTERSAEDEDGYSSITAIYMVQGTDSLQLYDAFGTLPVDDDNLTVVPDSLLSSEGILGYSDGIYYFSPSKIEIADAGPDTGINGVAANASARKNADVYSVGGVKMRKEGQSLNGLSKGLYIINGKKVVIK